MNKLKNYGFILIILFTSLIFSCSNLHGDKESETNEKAYICLSTDSPYRTIMPSFKPFEELKFVLKGSLNGNIEKTIGSWDSYSQMQDSSNDLIEITTGNWQFSLYAKNGESNVLSSTIDKQIISGVNTLSFDMSEVDGDGKIKVNLTIPLNSAEKITAGLFTLDNQPVENIKEEELLISNSRKSSVCYLKQHVSKGVYILRFFFYQNMDDSLPINSYSSIVKVSAGYESAGNLEVNQINHFYKIIYEMDFAQFKEGVVAPLNFNEYMQVDLPTQADFPEEFQFHGWYEKDNKDKGYITKIEKGTKEDKTFVCDSILCLSSLDQIKYTIEKYKISSDNLLKIKIKKATIYNSYYGSCMENIVGYKIALDLSECYFKETPVFSRCPCLISIILPSSVTVIENGAFIDCTSLTSIEIPSNVTEIGGSAFAGCTSLTSIEIPSSVAKIGDDTFYGCTSLTSIEIPSNVTEIGGYAFERCTSLTSIEIPSSVAKIGNGAFYGCTSLTSIEISSNVTEIRGEAFAGCTSLTSIKIPDGVKIIDYGTFNSCTSLTSIEISSNVTEIRGEAFAGCTSLTSIKIPDGVKIIYYGTFDSCTSLTSIKIPSSVELIDAYAFAGCTSLTSIEIPSSVVVIGEYAFVGCTSLTSLEIPSGIEFVGDYAFVNVPHIYYYGSLQGSPWGAKEIN